MPPDEADDQADHTSDCQAKHLSLLVVFRPQPVSRKGSHQHSHDRRDVGNDSLVVAVFVAAEDAGQEVLINPRGQITLRRQHARPVAGNRNEFHDCPVAEQESGSPHNLPLAAEVDHDERREKVADGNSLQDTGVTQMIKLEVEQAVVDQTEKNEQDRAAHHPLVKHSFAAAALEVLRERKRQHRSHDEHEQRENQVVKVETFPAHVVELGLQELSEGIVECFRQRVNQHPAAGDPEHVEPAQRVDGNNSTRHGRDLSS